MSPLTRLVKGRGVTTSQAKKTIMWTSTTRISDDRVLHVNHFVPLVPVPSTQGRKMVIVDLASEDSDNSQSIFPADDFPELPTQKERCSTPSPAPSPSTQRSKVFTPSPNSSSANSSSDLPDQDPFPIEPEIETVQPEQEREKTMRLVTLFKVDFCLWKKSTDSLAIHKRTVF